MSTKENDFSAKPAGDVPLPEPFAFHDSSPPGFFPFAPGADPHMLDQYETIKYLYTRGQLRAYGDAREAAGRADAVPARFGELPAPISNPEAWPENYAGGYNDALNMCYDVIRGHAPQPITTQGEAVATVVESLANGHALEFLGGYSETLDALPIGTKLYTGPQS